MAHDKTYEKIPAYKNYTDKRYTSAIHKATLVAFISAFVIFTLAQSILPNLFQLKPNVAQAGSNSVTWTSQGDFEGATRTNIDSTTSIDSVALRYGPNFLSGVKSVSNGGTGAFGNYAFTVAVKQDGTVLSWGYNGSGQLGNGTTTNSGYPVRVVGPDGVGFLSDVKMAVASTAGVNPHAFVLAVKNDGTVWGWGSNGAGELAQGDTTNKSMPVQIKGPGGSGFLTDVKSVAVGGYSNGGDYNYALALKNDGTVWGWGNNGAGQLGINNLISQTYPSQVKGAGGVGFLTGVGHISASWGSTYGVSMAVKTSDGSVWIWGNNFGQFTDGTTTDSSTPKQIKGPGGSGNLLNVKEALVFSSTYSDGGYAISLKNDGTVWGWGNNRAGQLGQGDNSTTIYPVQVKDETGTSYISNVKSISASNGTSSVISRLDHASAFAVLNNGLLYAWGKNDRGQLGQGNTTNSTLPLRVKRDAGNYLEDISFVSAVGYADSLNYAVAVSGDGSVWSWGSNGTPSNYGDGYTSISYYPRQAYNWNYPTNPNAYSLLANLGSDLGGSVGLRADTNTRSKPATLTWTATTASTGQKILFKVRSGNTQEELDANQCYGPGTGTPGSGLDSGCADWSTAGKFFSQINGQSNSSNNIDTNISAKRYIEVLVRLESDGSNTPTLDDVTVTYDTLEAPVNSNLTLTKSDGTTLKTSDGTQVAGGVPGAFSSDTSVKLTATGLTCGGGDSGQTACAVASTNLRPSVEIQPLGTAFTGTPTASATGSNNYVTLTGLSPDTSYHLQVRAIDDQGRVSGWTSYGANAESEADLTIEQTTPSGTVTIGGSNVTGGLTKSTDVDLTISGTDNGSIKSSPLASNLQMRLSNNGTDWGTRTNSDGTINPSYSDWRAYEAAISHWYLLPNDGTKNVYIQFKDNAGNVSGQLKDSTFDGTVTNTLKTNNSIILGPKQETYNGDARDGGITYDMYGATYFPTGTTVGVSGSVAHQTIAFFRFGIPSNNVTNALLYLRSGTVNNGTVTVCPINDFTSLNSADTTCLATEIIVTLNPDSWNTIDMTSWINLFISQAKNAIGLRFSDNLRNGVTLYTYESGANQPYISNVSSSGPPYAASGTYTSPSTSGILDAGATGLKYGSFRAVESRPSSTGITYTIRGGNTSTPDGTWTSYSAVTNGGAMPVAVQDKRYLQYIATLTTSNDTLTPVLDDVFIEVLTKTSSSISLDFAPPAAFNLTTPATDTWQSNSQPTLSWNASSDGSGISKYQLYIDNVLNRDNISGAATSTTPVSPLSEGNHPWKIVAVDGAGNTTDSTSTFNIGYDVSLPLAPASFTISANVSDLTLAWSFSNNVGAPISSVKVERIDWGNYDPGNPSEVWSGYDSYHSKTYAGSSTGTVYSTTDLDPDTVIAQGKKYAYRIQARDSVNPGYGAFSTVRSGLTQDSVFDEPVTNITVAPCNGTLNCSVNPSIPHKGYETKITWDPAIDGGVGTSHYLIYRSSDDLNSGNYQEPDIRESYEIVGVLPYQTGQTPTWYDNNANNDGITTFYDAIGDPITISSEIQALTTKTQASVHLDDYNLYYYRIVGVDLLGNKSPVFAESTTLGEFDVLKTYENGNTGQESERTPDVTAPTTPTGVNPTATGIDDLNSTPDPTQGILVSWDASTENSGRTVTYKLYRSLGTISGPGSWGGSPVYTGANTAYQDKGLDQDSYYYYRVTAQDPDTNISTTSDAGGVKTKNSQVPTTPTYVTVRATKGDPNTNDKVGTEINVQFNGSAIRYATNKITGYEVYRSETNYATEVEWFSQATKLAGISNLNIAGYEGSIEYDATRNLPADTVTKDGTRYYYRIRAVGENTDGIVYSSLSSIQTSTLNYGWDITPDAQAPQLPTTLKVKDIHDDGMNYKRNIITWERIPNPTRAGVNDFLEYRIYRSNDGLTWQQICKNGTQTVLLSSCDLTRTNPLSNTNQELAMANNYYMDLIPIAESNQFYYYYVTAIDNAGTSFKYPAPNQNTVINAYSNESEPALNSEGNISAVSLNPYIAKPSITTNVGGKKAILGEVGVSTAVVTWTTDQACDAMVGFRKAGSNDEYKQIGIGDANQGLGMSSSHSISLFGLTPNTTYDYKIVSSNSLGNPVIATGSDLPTLTTTGFNITPGNVVTTTSTAEINWTTNLDASSAFVEYQLQRQSGDEAQSGTAGVTSESLASNPRNHKVIVKGLRSNRTYTYKIKSISKDGYLAEYPQNSFSNFKTRNYDSAQFSLAPASSNVADKNITSTTAQIVWQTANPTTSWVDYGTQSGKYGISSGNDTLTTQHVVTLEGLVPGTKYYYHVRVKDENEVEFTSQEYSFTAVIKPKISNLHVTNITPYTATIAWETNVDTETVLNWGKTSAYGEKRGTAGKSKAHQVVVEGLEDNTEYHYQIVAHDEAGNEVVGSDEIIRTPLDTEGPKITNVKTDIMPIGDSDSTSQVIISWTTNKPATTKVEYDEGIIGGRYTKASTEDTTLNNSHTVIIKGLNVATTYHYRIVTRDKRGNTTTSNDYTFVTPAKEQSIWQLIVKSLQDTFAWTKNIGSIFKRK